MRKIIGIIIILLLPLTGCVKDKNITFQAEIESISEFNIIVITNDEVGFDRGSVDISEAKIDGDLQEGSKIKITIKPEIRESYPVQITATKIEVLKDTYKKITSKEAKEIIDKGEYDIILDVRTLEEYNEGYIKGAVLLPDNEISHKADSVIGDKDKVVLVYCRSGRRSKQAAQELMDMGYKNILDFGGINDWDYDVVK